MSADWNITADLFVSVGYTKFHNISVWVILLIYSRLRFFLREVAFRWPAFQCCSEVDGCCIDAITFGISQQSFIAAIEAAQNSRTIVEEQLALAVNLSRYHLFTSITSSFFVGIQILHPQKIFFTLLRISQSGQDFLHQGMTMCDMRMRNMRCSKETQECSYHQLICSSPASRQPPLYALEEISDRRVDWWGALFSFFKKTNSYTKFPGVVFSFIYFS